MPKTHVSRLLVTGAASAALAVGGLSLTPTTAQAAGAAGATYSCAGLGDVPVTYSLPALPLAALAGVPIAAQPLNAALTLPAGTTYKSGAIDNLLVAVGFGDVPVSLGSAPITNGVLNVTGALGSINPGLAVPIPVAFPKSFNLSLQGAKGAPVTFTCSQGAEPAAGTIQVSQQESTLKAAPAAKKVKASKNGEIKVDVTRQVGAPTGKVYAIWKGKTIGQAKLKRSGGQVVLKLAKLAPGSYKINVKYEGDPVTKAAAQNVKITVVR